jgi:hypothetical protein
MTHRQSPTTPSLSIRNKMMSSKNQKAAIRISQRIGSKEDSIKICLRSSMSAYRTLS